MSGKFLKKYNASFFLSDDLDGAPIKVGTRIKKINSEDGDAHPDGTTGKVIGSLSEPVTPDNSSDSQYCYAVVWDCRPQVAIGTIGKKLEIDRDYN